MSRREEEKKDDEEEEVEIIEPTPIEFETRCTDQRHRYESIWCGRKGDQAKDEILVCPGYSAEQQLIALAYFETMATKYGWDASEKFEKFE